MPTETLHFDNARFAQQLFAHDAQNLKTLEELLGVKATSREGWIKLDGPQENIERARQFFLTLESTTKAGGALRRRNVARRSQPSRRA